MGAFVGHRDGLTPVEVVVAFAVVAALVALVLPAISHSRGAARRATCANRLGQVALASFSAAEVSGYLPVRPTGPPPFLVIYPHLGVGEPPEFSESGGGRTPKVLVCPSGQRPEWPGVVGFRFCDGEAAGWTGYNGTALPARLGQRIDGVTLASVSDGLSNTALASERLPRSGTGVNPGPDDPGAARLVWGVDPPPSAPAGWRSLAAACLTGKRDLPWGDEAKAFLSQRRGYSHAMPPNAPSCYRRRSGHAFTTFTKLIAATSNHRGRVHVAFADGHVSPVSDTIDAALYLSLSTRSGHEAVSF